LRGKDNCFKKGGETASTGVKELRLHTEVHLLVKRVKINTNADDYAYSLAA
jgi:hypothetical protein